MVIKRFHRRRYKALPPHSNEAYPLTNLGEVSKTLIIAVVAVVAIVGLTLLLFFSDKFVGKAIQVSADIPVNSAGIFLVSNDEVVGRDITFPIMANIGEHETIAIQFKIGR